MPPRESDKKNGTPVEKGGKRGIMVEKSIVVGVDMARGRKPSKKKEDDGGLRICVQEMEVDGVRHVMGKDRRWRVATEADVVMSREEAKDAVSVAIAKGKAAGNKVVAEASREEVAAAIKKTGADVGAWKTGGRTVGDMSAEKYPIAMGEFRGLFADVDRLGGYDSAVLQAYFEELREMKRERLVAGDYSAAWLEMIGVVTEATYREAAKKDNQWEMKFLRIQDDNAEIVRYKPREAQTILREKIWEMDKSGKPVRVVLGKPRQFGGSTEIAAYIYEKTKWKINSRGLVVADKAPNSLHLFGMYATYYANDPTRRPAELLAKSLVYHRTGGEAEALQAEMPEDLYDLSDIIDPEKGDESFDKKVNSGYIHVETGGAKQAGRSRTIQFLHCSEVAFFETPHTTMPALLQVVPPYVDTAVFIESTANGVGGWYYDMWRGYDDGYVRVFIPWYIVEKYRVALTADDQKRVLDTLTDYEEFLVKEKGVTPEKIEWRRLKVRENHGNEDIVKQEYPSTPEEMFIGSGRPVFQVAAVKAGLDGVAEREKDGFKPQKYHIYLMPGSSNEDYARALSSRGKLAVWDKPRRGHEYVIGVDPAEGGIVNFGTRDPDFTAMQVLDRGAYANDPYKPLTQVARYCDRPEVIDLPGYIMLLSDWYNGAWVCVESNNHGNGVINSLVEKGFTKLMERPSPEVIEVIRTGGKSIGVEKTQMPRTNRAKFGWFTGPKTRPLMIDDLVRVFYNEELVVLCKDTLSQMQQFMYDDVGRPEAAAGAHDDLVFSLALAIQCDRFTPRSGRNRPPKQKTLEESFLEDLDKG